MAMHRALLGIGIGAVGTAIFGFVVFGVIGMESSRSWGGFGFPSDSVTRPMGPTRGMGPGMMGGMWTDPGDAAPIEPAFPIADDLTITLSDFAFDPSAITVQEGQVNITLDNEGAAVHDLTIPDLGIRILVSPGESIKTGQEFNAPGTYDTLCSIPGHASLGMTGSLVVLPTT